MGITELRLRIHGAKLAMCVCSYWLVKMMWRARSRKGASESWRRGWDRLASWRVTTKGRSVAMAWGPSFQP